MPSPRLALYSPGEVGTAERFRLGSRPCLDGLRGFATLAVVLCHFRFIRGGVVGLEILFVLSGFLITVMLIEEWEKKGAVSLGGFFRRRFLRILPPLAALFVVGSAIGIAIGFQSPYEMLLDCAVAGSFTSNGILSHVVPKTMLGHTWLLSLEVQFYLLWPVLFCVMLRGGVRRERIIMLLALLVVAVAAYRAVAFVGRPPEARASGPLKTQHAYHLYVALKSHSDTLLIGCLVGALVAWNRLPTTPRFARRLDVAGWASLAAVGYALIFCHHELNASFCGLFTLIGLWTAVVIVWLMREPPRWLSRVLESRPLVGTGRISYALYLFHMPIIGWMDPQTLGARLTGLALSFAAAILSFYTIERSVVRARRPAAPAPVAIEIEAPAPLRRAA